MRLPRLTIGVALLAVAVLGVSPVGADIAVMADGRVLRVTEVRPLGDEAWLLSLLGGGEISCARARLREVRPDPPRVVSARGAVEPEPWRVMAGGLETAIERLAGQHGLEPQLVVAVIKAESNFDTLARSPKGALGLMQLMPGTANDLAVRDPYDPVQNIRGGTAYLGQLLDRFGGDLELALAAYNAGPEAVERHGGVPPYPETQDYVRRVLAQYGRL
jgi:hypothetical protein